MGSMFDRAFRMFSDAFEKRADKIYGRAGQRLSVLAPLSAISSAVLHRSRRRMKSRPRSSNSRCSAIGSLARHGEPEPHQPDRLFGRAAARPGNAGDGQRDAGARMRQRACRHLQRGLARHRAVRVERRPGNAEHLHLGFVGIGDEAAVDHSDEPGMSVSAAAIMPPVQDSAVASMIFCARQASSTARASASNRPVVAHSGKPSGIDDACRGDRRDAFLAADEAELLVGRRLDRNALRRNAEHLGQIAAPSPRGAARPAAPRRSG